MPGQRALGSNARMKHAWESAYGVPETSGYLDMPFVSSQLGEEQGKIASDLLGQGREPLDPDQDVINNDGDVVVPVDTRYFGVWLTDMMGAPTTAGAVAGGGSFTFSANPAATGTITLNGTAWTFIASGASGPQTNIGVNLGATLTQLVIDLNASADAQVSKVTWSTTGGNTLVGAYDTAGLGANAYTLAANANSHATPSGATMSGGANKHTWTSGSTDLPSADIEVGFPEVPSYGVNYGGRGATLKVAMARSGLLNATLNMICQGEALDDATADGSSTSLGTLTRFSQFLGAVQLDDADLASVETAEWMLSNDLEKVEVIRSDGRIEDADPGTVAVTCSLTMRFRNTDMLDKATAGTPVKLTFGHFRSATEQLLVTVFRAFLPKSKRPVAGPKGVRLTMQNIIASKDPSGGHAFKVELTNDVAGAVYTPA